MTLSFEPPASPNVEDQLHDCRPGASSRHGCAESHEMWRWFSVDGSAEWPLGAPFCETPDGSFAGWPAGGLKAICAYWRDWPDHDVPAPGCNCGFRVVATPAHVARGVLAHWRIGQWSEVRQPDLTDMAIGAVGAYGLFRDCHDPMDYQGYVRVGGVQIQRYSKIVLPASAERHAARIREAYRLVDLEVRPLNGVEFLASFLNEPSRRICQACGREAVEDWRGWPSVENGLCVEDELACLPMAVRRIMRDGGRV
jgi:hypothetical protein